EKPSINEKPSKEFQVESKSLKDLQNNSTLPINSQTTEEVKEVIEFLITETSKALQDPNYIESCQTFEQNEGDNINFDSSISNTRNDPQDKLAPQIADTMENIVKQVEIILQNESNISYPNDTDTNTNETTYILVEEDINQDIIDVMDDLIKEIELKAQTTIQAEPNTKPSKKVEENINCKITSAQNQPERPPPPSTKTNIEKCPEALTSLKEHYDYKGLLGRGKFGQVYFLCHKITKEEVAAKIVYSRRVKASEKGIWPTLAHPNILKLLEQHVFGEYHIFVSPKQEKELLDIIHKAPFTEVKLYMLDALRGLEYLHHMGLCHLDIKADNILIGKHGAMICDFGFVAQSKGLTNSDFGLPVLCTTTSTICSLSCTESACVDVLT
ncbi:hypothetical protein JTE90_003217, partial [Oedothorax gibbosus]